ncbi:MAG: phage tail family protein [Desulfocucumaceae bacterium]
MGNEDLGSLVAKLAADLTDLKKGLAEGRQQFASFQNFMESGVKQIKSTLSFAGITLGLGVLFSELNSLIGGAIEAGSKLETLKLSAYAVGQNFSYSAESIDHLVSELKNLKMGTAEAYNAVSNFISHGLDPRQLAPLAQAAKDLAVAAGQSPQEMFKTLIDAIVTGTPRALRAAKIPIREFQDAILADSKGLDESLKLSAQERSQIMIDLIREYAKTVEGVDDSTSGSYSRQLGNIKYVIQQIKEVLWELAGPAVKAIAGEQIKSWQELLNWLTKNKEALQSWGKTIGEFLTMVWGVVSATVAWVVANGSLLKNLLEFGIAYKLSGYIIALTTAAQAAVPALYALATGATVAKVAFGGWLAILAQIAITLAALGAYSFIKNPVTTLPGGQRYIEWGSHGMTELPSISSGETTPGSEGAGHEEITSPQEKLNSLNQEVQAGLKKWQEMFGKNAGAGKGGGGGGADDHLLKAMLSMFKAQRDAELGAAQNSLDLLKTTNDKKRAELEKSLAEGLIDGQAYYQRLQELQQEETAAALVMIDRKRQAQQKSYQDSLQELQADEKLSPEAKDLAQRKLAAENNKALAKLDTEAAQARLEGEVKITNELKRQVEVRKEYGRKTEDLNLETATLLGAISDQESKLQKLYLDWQRAKEDAIKAGASPEYFRALELNYQAKVFDSGPWAEKMKAEGQILASALSDLAGSLWDSGVKFAQACDQLGKKILKDTFKLFFDDFAKAINQGIKSLVSSITAEIGGAGAGGGFGGFFSGIWNWLTGSSGGGGTSSVPSSNYANVWPSAHGNVFHEGVRLALAHGGVLTRPTLFPLAKGGYAEAGEAGLEAAFAPLTRIGGDLGVKALVPRPGPTQVTIINNSGVDVKGNAEMQDDGTLKVVLEREMAGAVMRGGPLHQAILNTYDIKKRF